MAGQRTRRAEGIDALVASFDPVDASRLAGGEIEAALDEIGWSVASQPRLSQAPRRGDLPRGRWLVLGLAAALIAVTAGVAVGAVLSAHTGRFVPTVEVPMGGPGEELNPAAPDFHRVALEAAADIPYPDGYGAWRELVISDASDPSGLVSSGALRGWFAASAFCAWVQDWRHAVMAGNGKATAQAEQMIAQAPSWKAVRDEDPHPDPAAANDPGAEPGTLFGWLLPYRDAVLAGDAPRVEHLLAYNYGNGKCWLSDPAWRAELATHRDWGTLSPDEMATKYEQFLAGGRS